MNLTGGLASMLATVLPIGQAQVATETPDCSQSRGAAIAAGVSSALAKFPSASGRLLVVHCGTTVLDRPFGLANREARLPVTAATQFDFGSLTKQFVAAAILKLRDQGRLDLGDPISKYIVGLPPSTGGITIHQLLTHSSGLPLYSGEDYDQPSRESFVDWLRTAKLERSPGSAYSYSNPGYSVLAMIVEQRSGVTLEQFLDAEFFSRLGIESLGYRRPQPPFAVNYLANGRSDGTPLQKAWRAEGPFWNLYGNGGMLANVADFRSWFEALRSGKLLTPESTAAMFTPHIRDPKNTAAGIGYGWRIFDDKRGRWINHGGSNGESYFADVRYFLRYDALMIISLNQFDVEQVREFVRSFADAASAGEVGAPTR